MDNRINNQKFIYVALTQTNTLLACAIRMFTKHRYSHVSLSFDKDCFLMYSFGRKYYHNPVLGIFKRESITDRIFSGKQKNRIALYRLGVTEEEFEQIQQNVIHIDKINNGFNIIGLIAAAFDFKINRNKYYCAEFVHDAIAENTALLNHGSNLPVAVRPEDIVLMNNRFELVYEGRVIDFIKQYL